MPIAWPILRVSSILHLDLLIMCSVSHLRFDVLDHFSRGSSCGKRYLRRTCSGGTGSSPTAPHGTGTCLEAGSTTAWVTGHGPQPNLPCHAHIRYGFTRWLVASLVKLLESGENTSLSTEYGEVCNLLRSFV
jgi:hypothetical protein